MTSKVVSLPPMDSDKAAPILEAMERAIRDMAPVTPLVGAQFAYEAIRSFMPKNSEMTAPQWIDGPPAAPGWYVVQRTNGRYDAMKLEAFSNLFMFPQPDNYRILRHFAFDAYSPEKTSVTTNSVPPGVLPPASSEPASSTGSPGGPDSGWDANGSNA